MVSNELKSGPEKAGAEAAVWLHYADSSYVATRLLWFTKLLIDSAVYGHRTLELYLKAFLISRGIEVKPRSPAWGHDLASIGEEAQNHDQAFARDDVQRRLRFFVRYFVYVRYPRDGDVPDDGSLTWIAFDANIMPLDELLAFVRPRIRLSDEDWRSSLVHELIRDGNSRGYQRDALINGNQHVSIIDCVTSGDPDVTFDASFRYDRPGC